MGKSGIAWKHYYEESDMVNRLEDLIKAYTKIKPKREVRYAGGRRMDMVINHKGSKAIRIAIEAKLRDNTSSIDCAVGHLMVWKAFNPNYDTVIVLPNDYEPEPETQRMYSQIGIIVLGVSQVYDYLKAKGIRTNCDSTVWSLISDEAIGKYHNASELIKACNAKEESND
jgi:hypothetical protein